VIFQYLRMMGGVDTVMSDKIVKRVVNEISVKLGLKPVEDDIELSRRLSR
jgi:dephospho-CoA kinase